MEARIGGGALNLGWKKKKSSISRFVREVRRLNCSINYGGSAGVARRPEKISWDLVPVD